MSKETLVQEYQSLLYQLLNTHVLSLEAVMLQSDGGAPEQYLNREDVVDKLILVMNKFGEEMKSDGRFKHETQSGTNDSIPESTKKD